MNDPCVSKSIFFFKCHLPEEVIAKILLLKDIKTSMLEGSQTAVLSSRKSGCEFSWLVLLLCKIVTTYSLVLHTSQC